MTTLSCEYCPATFDVCTACDHAGQKYANAYAAGWGRSGKDKNEKWYCGPCCFKEKRCKEDGCEKLVDKIKTGKWRQQVDCKRCRQAMIDGATKTLKLFGYDEKQLKELDEELLIAPAVVPPAPPFPPWDRATVSASPTQTGASSWSWSCASWSPSLEFGMGELFNLKKQIEDVREELKQCKNDANEKLEQVTQELQQCKHELKQVKQELQQYKHDNNETLDQMRQESHQCKNDDTEKLEQKLELRLCKGTHSEQLKQLGETMKCNQISYNRQFEQMGQKLQLCKDDQVEALTSMRCELEQCKKAVCDQVFHTFTEVAQGAPGDEGALAQQPAASRDLHHPSSMTPPSETHDGISTNAADMEEIVFVETSGSDIVLETPGHAYIG